MLQTIILAAAAIVTSQPAVTPSMDEDYIQIEFEDPEGRDNRGPVIIPVSGYVDQLAGWAVLSFSSPCGQVQVQLENLDDGSSVSTSVAGTGSALIPFSCSSGLWRMTLTLSGGVVYIGEFTI